MAAASCPAAGTRGSGWHRRSTTVLHPAQGTIPAFCSMRPIRRKGRTSRPGSPHCCTARREKPPRADEMLIVRPDGYIGYSGGGSDWESAERYLGRWRG